MKEQSYTGKRKQEVGGGNKVVHDGNHKENRDSEG